jgi:hypothetical protein
MELELSVMNPLLQAAFLGVATGRIPVHNELTAESKADVLRVTICFAQARRTGSSSALGQLFDHGCDALGVTFINVATLSAFGVGRFGQ